MLHSTSVADVAEAIRTILGDSPKSSLLFGAPAISLRQLESSLEIPAATLVAADILPTAAQVASEVFKGSKQAQLKILTRGGKQEEWIVFRPCLPGSTPALPLPPPRPLPRNEPPPARPPVKDPSPEIVRNLGLEPMVPELGAAQAPKRGFFRPFFKSKTSQGNVPFHPASEIEEQPLALPPAHKIGAGGFDAAWIPVAEPAPSPTRPALDVQQPPALPTANKERWPTPPNRAAKLAPQGTLIVGASTQGAEADLRAEKFPVQKPLRLGPLDDFALTKDHRNVGSKPSVRDAKVSRPPLAPRVHPIATSRLPRLEDSDMRVEKQRYVPVDIDRPARATAAEQAPSSMTSSDSSLPYLSNRAKVKVDPEPSRDEPADFEPRNLDLLHVEKTSTQHPPSTLDIKLSPTTDKVPHSRTRRVSPPAPLSPLSPLSPLPSDSEPPSPQSPAPPPPWSQVVFRDLPFGPDVPAFQILTWARHRWQILSAELVIILGAVYNHSGHGYLKVRPAARAVTS